MPARRHPTHGPSVAGSSLCTTALATAAALGAVATGAFTALVPTPGDGTTTSASADESRSGVTLAADTATMRTGGGSALLPVVDVVHEEAGGAATDEDLTSLDKATVLADELAALHAQQAREQAERDRIGTVITHGGLDGWIAEALRILDLPQSLAPSVENIVMAESGGNPHAINTWDSNARRGTPSQGLMQTIPPTFRAYVPRELADHPITDPVANLTAGIRYMIDNYGLDTLEAGGRTTSSGTYVGY